MKDLDELIAACVDSQEPNWVELYRNDLAAHGPAAVRKLEPWLVDSRRGPRAVNVMVRAGQLHDAKPTAVRALRRARANREAQANWSVIDDALRRLGAKDGLTPLAPRPGPPLPKGTWVAPAVDVIHHIIQAHVEGVPVYGGDVYLFYCGRAFSGGWVRKHGGVLDPADRTICGACFNRM